jgi:pilus assembly protein CpaE
MLRGIIICPDADLSERLEALLNEIGIVSVTRTLDRYPNSLELIRFLRAHAPQVIFISTESTTKALEIARDVEKNTPGVQVVAVSRFCDAQILLEVMRAGIREFASLPFDRETLTEGLMRLKDALDAKPPRIETTDQVFSFLPSKAGVGTSTIALHTAKAISRLLDTNTLLTDFDLNSGMLRFMLKLDNPYCVTDAAAHSLDMDESLWPTMVTTMESLDVLHAGKLNPDFRIEPTQIRHLLEFMRRNYRSLCFDLSGNLEKYSLEIMHESRRVFLVCTPEITSLHLAREKYLYLKQLDLGERVRVLLNRCQKRSLITPQQIEQLLGLPVHMTFPNDYQGVQRALTEGRWVELDSELGKQFTALAGSMIEIRRPGGAAAPEKKGLLEFFSVVPGKGVKNPVAETSVDRAR